MSRLGAPSLLPASPWHRRNDAALGVCHDAKPPEAPPAACLPHKYRKLPLFSLSSSVVIAIKDMPLWPDPCVDDLSGMETFGSAMGGSCNSPPPREGHGIRSSRPEVGSVRWLQIGTMGKGYENRWIVPKCCRHSSDRPERNGPGGERICDRANHSPIRISPYLPSTRGWNPTDRDLA